MSYFQKVGMVDNVSFHVFCCVVQLEKCSQDLGNSTKAVSSAIAQLLSEATQGNENYTGEFNITRMSAIKYIFCSRGKIVQ